jgi:cohesin domain-containing protein
MIKRVLLYFALLLWFVVPLSAQPTIFIEDESIDPNSNISIDVKMSDFIDIVSIQFTINWDSAFLKFDSVSISDPSVLPEYNSANIGTTNAHLGKLITSWVSPDLSGVTLDDSTALFILHYTVLGAAGNSSEIDITNTEFSNGNGDVLDGTVESGTVTVLQSNGIENSNLQINHAFTLYQNEPNPFDNQTVIKFDVHEPSDFVLEVYDLKGSLVYAHKAYYLSGNQTIILSKEMLPLVGTYFYKLKTKDYFITNRMILVR